MRTKNRSLVVLTATVLAFGSIGGAAAAAPTPPTTPACTAATQQLGFANNRLNEAVPTRNNYQAKVATLTTQRQAEINRGDVAAVGQTNVKIGNTQPLLTTMDNEVAAAQAQVVQARAAKRAACS